MSAIDDELEQLEREDAEAQASEGAARAEQAKVDRVAYLKLKKQHGDHLLGVLNLARWKPGFPTLLVVRAMDRAAHRRFEEMSSAQSKEKRRQAVRCAVNDTLLYPDEKTFAAMAEVFTELPGQVAVEALGLSKAKAAEEGKG